MKIGLWIQDSAGSAFLIAKDRGGYPRLISCRDQALFFGSEQGEPDLSSEEGKRLYQEVTGKPYPFSHATSRQVIWDLLEASLKFLP